MRSFKILLIIFLFGTTVYSQPFFSGMFGENVLGSISRRIDRSASEEIHSLTYTEKDFILSLTTVTLFSGDSRSQTGFGIAPFETRIVSANFKSDNPDIAFVLFSDGTVLVLRWKPSEFGGGKWEFSMNERIKIFAVQNFATLKKIVGDAVYVLAGGSIYASWDTAKTWTLDSANIGSLTVSDVTVDTNRYGWAATNQGVYYQHPDSNIWRKVSPIPGAQQNITSIFADRRSRIFISRPGKIYFSTDRGTTWQDRSDASMQSIVSFGDDAFGNIYAVGSGSQAYRLSDVTLPWVPIADSINSRAYLPSSSKIINAISGDSVLYAATRYGLFTSTDQGTRWNAAGDSLQPPSHTFYSGLIRSGGFDYISNNLGVYRRSADDSVWTKIFPKNGFIWGVNAIAGDSAGNVYGNFPLKTGPSSSVFYPVVSTDHGGTWVTDSAGFKSVGILSGTQNFDHFVTKQGVQYLGGSGIVYSKLPGMPWKKDTAGIGLKPGEFIADISLNNKKGITYLGRRAGTFPTYTLAVYSRSNGDSIWHPVSIGPVSASEGRLVSDQNGDIVLRTLSGSYKVWRYDGNNWSEIPLPTGIGSSPFINHMNVDGSGTVWGSFFAGGSNKGIYCTTNNGAMWKYAGLNGVGIKFLSTVEDPGTIFRHQNGTGSGSVLFAVTIIDGVHRFTAGSLPTTGISRERTAARSYELQQNYPNPFNPSTTIAFTVPVRTAVKLSVYDMLGRELAVLVNEEKNAGTYTVPFNAATFSSGVYLCRMSAGNFTSTRKLLLQK